MGGARYGSRNDDDALASVQRALDQGITLFDTALAYGVGHSESLMGRALQGHWDEVVLVTKTGIVPNERADAFFRDSRPHVLREQCEASLRELGTDRIDVYLIHWPDPDTPIDETMRAMEELQNAGKIGHVGVSNYSTAQMNEARAVTTLVANQVGYHMLDRRKQDEIIPYCARHDIGVMAYGSLAHGVLTGTFSADPQFDDDDWRKSGQAFGLPLFDPAFLPDTLEAVDEVTDAAARVHLTTAQLALRWVLEEPAVSTALVGFRTPAEVDAAVAAVQADVPADVMASADSAAQTAYARLRAAELPISEVGPLRRTT